MDTMIKPVTKRAAVALCALTVAACGSTAGAGSTSTEHLNVKYGVLVALTGSSGSSGQLWYQASLVAVDYINKTLKQMGLSNSISVTLSDSQDTQGMAASGVEAAQKLVSIDGVNVVMGDILSSVTAAVATAVTIPGHVVQFTGGTATSLPQLNPTSGPPYLYQPPAANDIEAGVLTQIIAAAYGSNAAVNVGAENDAYGAGLAAEFKQDWIAQGGTIPEYVLYNETQPTLDTEADKLVEGSPAAWLFIDYCANFPKLSDPLQRTGQWDAAKSFGSDTLVGCQSQGYTAGAIPGMRAVRADVSAGATLPQYQAYYQQTSTGGGAFQGWTAEAFDSVIVSFLAALEAKSSNPETFAKYIGPLTNAPGTKYTFTQLNQAIAAIRKGQKVQYVGVSGPLNFKNNGAAGTAVFQVFEVQQGGASNVSSTVNYSGTPAATS